MKKSNIYSKTAFWRHWKLAVIGRWLLLRGDHLWGFCCIHLCRPVWMSVWTFYGILTYISYKKALECGFKVSSERHTTQHGYNIISMSMVCHFPCLYNATTCTAVWKNFLPGILLKYKSKSNSIWRKTCLILLRVQTMVGIQRNEHQRVQRQLCELWKTKLNKKYQLLTWYEMHMEIKIRCQEKRYMQLYSDGKYGEVDIFVFVPWNGILFLPFVHVRNNCAKVTVLFSLYAMQSSK